MQPADDEAHEPYTAAESPAARKAAASALSRRVGPGHAILWVALALMMAMFMSQVSSLLSGPATPSTSSRLRDGGDSFGHWFALQAVMSGRDAYGPDVTAATQLAIWDAGAPAGVQAYAYPLPALVWYVPLAWLPFEATALYARALGLIGLAGCVVAVAHLAGWRRRGWSIVAAIGLMGSLGGVYDQVGLGQSAAVAIAAALLVVSLYRGGHPLAAGLAVPLLAIKPQYMPVLLAGLTLHALSVRRRRRFLVGAGASLVLVMAAGWLVSPGWIAGWLANIGAYRYQLSFLGALVGDPPVARWLVQVATVGVPIAWWWRQRREPTDGPWFLVACAGSLACGMVTMSGNPSLYNVLAAWPLMAVLVIERPLPVEGRVWRAGAMLVRMLAMGLPIMAGMVLFTHAVAPQVSAQLLASLTAGIIWLGLWLGGLVAAITVIAWAASLVPRRWTTDVR